MKVPRNYRQVLDDLYSRKDLSYEQECYKVWLMLEVSRRKLLKLKFKIN